MTKSGCPRSSDPTHHQISLHCVHFTRARRNSPLSHVLFTHVLPLVRRSRNKKFCKERQGRTGVKVRVGSHLDGPAARQCPRCDRGKQKRCLRLKHQYSGRSPLRAAARL